MIRCFIHTARSISSIFTPKETNLVHSGSAQADINIFTVASGLLYEVRGDFCHHYPSFTRVFHIIALRVNHDPGRFAQHEEQRQILVYREFPVSFVPCE
jgi:hypothetical protein